MFIILTLPKVKMLSSRYFCDILFLVRYDDEVVFRVFLFFLQAFNPQTAKYLYIRFSIIVWFLQFLSYFLFLLEGSNKLILFCTKFRVKRARLSTSKRSKQQTSTAKFPLFFQKFETEERALRVKKVFILIFCLLFISPFVTWCYAYFYF